MAENDMAVNIDLLYSRTSDIFALAQELFFAFCLYLLCRDFTKKKLNAASAGALYFVVCTVFYYIPYEMLGFTAHNGAILAAFILFAILDRRNTGMKAVLLVTSCVVRWAVLSSTVRTSIFLSETVQRIMSGFLSPEDLARWRYFYAEFVVWSVLDLILGSLVLYIVMKQLGRILSYRYEELGLRELMVMLVPTLGSFTIYGVFTVYMDAYEKDRSIPIYQARPYTDLLHILSCAALMAMMITTYALYQNIRKKRDEENANILLESQVQEMQSHIEQVESLYAGMRGVKHDIKNHVEVINSLLARGKDEEAKEYAGRLSAAAEAFDLPEGTGNPVTDVIVHEKACRAKSLGIDFTSDFHYPLGSAINAFDISVILSNALSNAMEAAKEGGYIRLSSFRNRNAYLIIVENSCDEKLDIDEASSLARTKKKDGASHGYGFLNMRQAALKYNGDVMIAQEDGKVTLTVMLTT